MASIGQYPTDDELAEMIRIADADGTGDVDFAEFVTLMAHKMSDTNLSYLRSAFEVFDTDRNGFISSDEMCRVLSGVGEPVTHAEVQRVMANIHQGRPMPAAAAALGEQNEVLTYDE